MTAGDGGPEAVEAAATNLNLAGIDKKILAGFPDLERMPMPSAMVSKAGVAMQKRLGKLQTLKLDLEKCQQTDLVTEILGECFNRTRFKVAFLAPVLPCGRLEVCVIGRCPQPAAACANSSADLRMTSRIEDLKRSLTGADAEMQTLFKTGLLDGYSGQLLRLQKLWEHWAPVIEGP